MGVSSTDVVTTRDDRGRWGEVSFASRARFADRLAVRESHEQAAKYLSVLAHAWLAAIRSQGEGQQGAVPRPWPALTVPEVRGLLAVALSLPARSRELGLAWSWWRRARRWQARCTHHRRGAEQAR